MTSLLPNKFEVTDAEPSEATYDRVLQSANPGALHNLKSEQRSSHVVLSSPALYPVSHANDSIPLPCLIPGLEFDQLQFSLAS